MLANNRLLDFSWPVLAFAPAVPSSAVVPLISLKGYARCAAALLVKNATIVTGAAVALVQAKTVAGTPKALAFDTMFANLDIAAGRLFTKTAVVSNTFTTLATDSKNAMYLIDIPMENLDIANEYDCIGVTLGDATAATIGVLYMPYAPRHAGQIVDPGAD